MLSYAGHWRISDLLAYRVARFPACIPARSSSSRSAQVCPSLHRAGVYPAHLAAAKTSSVLTVEGRLSALAFLLPRRRKVLPTAESGGAEPRRGHCCASLGREDSLTPIIVQWRLRRNGVVQHVAAPATTCRTLAATSATASCPRGRQRLAGSSASLDLSRTRRLPEQEIRKLRNSVIERTRMTPQP